MAKNISSDNRNRILSGSILSSVLVLAVPVMLNSFLQSMYNLTDTFWLGKLGTVEQSAITLITPFQNILQNFGSGITTAGAILIGQELGARRDREAASMATHVFVCTLLFSVVCTVFCFLISPPLIAWLGAEDVQYSYALTYIRIVVLDMPLLYLLNIYTAVRQAQGDAVRPMFLNLIGILVNMIMDPLLMIVFPFGIAGAAVATLAAKLPGACLALFALTRPGRTIQINIKGFRFDREKIRLILKIGLPAAIGGSTMQFGFLLMTKNVQVFGKAATTAYGIGNKLNSLITLPNNGIGSAVSTIVSLNIGAGQYKRADKSFHLALRLSAAYLFISGMILSRHPVSAAFVGTLTSDPEVAVMAAEFLSLMAFWSWNNAFYNVPMGIFQGSGHTMVTMGVDAARIWVFRFLTLWICQSFLHMGVESVWHSVVVSNAVSALILYLLYWTGLWRKKVK